MRDELRREQILCVEYFPRSLKPGSMFLSDREMAEILDVERFSSKECAHRTAPEVEDLVGLDVLLSAPEGIEKPVRALGVDGGQH